MQWFDFAHLGLRSLVNCLNFFIATCISDSFYLSYQYGIHDIQIHVIQL